MRLNTTKCEIAGLGVLKGVKTALCGMVCIDLTKETIKILGIHYSYIKHIQVEKNFYDHVKAIETVLKAWRMRNLTLQGKITIFKTLAISKIVHLALVLPVPSSVIKELNKIQQNFIWSGKNSKIKHGTLRNDYENGGLKNLDIESKMISLRCSWVKRLYDESLHEWKVIPNYLITQALGDNFRFHSNLKFNKFFRNSLKSTLPIFYQDLFTNWSKNLCSPVMLPSAIASQFLWHNRFIEIDVKTIYWSNFSENNINFVGQLFQNGKLKSWSVLKVENRLHEKQKFKWTQLVHVIHSKWRTSLLQDNGNSNNLVLFNHHLIKNTQICSLEKLNSQEMCNIQILHKNCEPTGQIYYKDLLNGSSLEWKEIYLLPRLTTIDNKLRVFQYKILHHVLFLNKRLFTLRKTHSTLCFFCNLENETATHIFAICNKTQRLWETLQWQFRNHIQFPLITPQSAVFGFFEIDHGKNVLMNNILLIFKYFVYTSRNSGILNFNSLQRKIINAYKMELSIALSDDRKRQKFLKKWNPIKSKLENLNNLTEIKTKYQKTKYLLFKKKKLKRDNDILAHLTVI